MYWLGQKLVPSSTIVSVSLLIYTFLYQCEQLTLLHKMTVLVDLLILSTNFVSCLYVAYDFLFMFNSDNSCICLHYGDIDNIMFLRCFYHFLWL